MTEFEDAMTKARNLHFDATTTDLVDVFHLLPELGSSQVTRVLAVMHLRTKIPKNKLVRLYHTFRDLTRDQPSMAREDLLHCYRAWRRDEIKTDVLLDALGAYLGEKE